MLSKENDCNNIYLIRLKTLNIFSNPVSLPSLTLIMNCYIMVSTEMRYVTIDMTI